VPPIALASLEKEASTEDSLVLEVPRDSARNGRLPGAGHAIQPEYTFAARVVGPVLYPVEKLDSSIGMTWHVVLFGVGVERGIVRSSEFIY
jgi:hypothetical protein